VRVVLSPAQQCVRLEPGAAAELCTQGEDQFAERSCAGLVAEAAPAQWEALQGEVSQREFVGLQKHSAKVQQESAEQRQQPGAAAELDAAALQQAAPVQALAEQVSPPAARPQQLSLQVAGYQGSQRQEPN
jgi:hypothetical protein